MLETYIESLMNTGLFADAMMVFDADGIAVQSKRFRTGSSPINENDMIGKNILEIYPHLTKETSNIYRALAGIPTINQLTERHYATGEVVTYIENNFPIKHYDKIVGVLSIIKHANTLIHEVDLVLQPALFSPETAFPYFHQTGRYRLSDIIGDSEPIQELKSKILQTAKTNSPVLIYGQTGTGKELVAQAIYSESSRCNGSFLSQNCAAIPQNLLESLFFGTTKGSYTGALDKSGIFEQAKGGILFLDEINSMDLSMQAKILKVIEEKEVTRIGATKPVKLDVRIIAATNEPPQFCIQQGKLRSDLFYRLSAVQIELPPLYKHPSDIPLLTHHFINQYNRELGREIHGVSPEVSSIFQNYFWPGNIRELKNVLEGAFNFSSGPLIERKDLPSFLKNLLSPQPLQIPDGGILELSPQQIPEVTQETRPEESKNTADRKLGSRLTRPAFEQILPLKQAMSQFEQDYILSRIPYARNLSDLATQLGLTPQALHYKLKKYDIHP